MDRSVSVIVLSGFLGSGKTTFLGKAVRYMKQQQRKVAVVMNELGEVNLDGIAIDIEVPMAELLDGCICCTIRGDLGLTIQQLIQEQQPDVIFIEATGVAHPMEILDGVTEASLYTKVEVKEIVTIADAAFLLDQIAKGSGKTYRLLEEQVRCASVLLLNKTDLVDERQLVKIEAVLQQWNAAAVMLRTVQADVDLHYLFEDRHSESQQHCNCDCFHNNDSRKAITSEAHQHSHDHTHDHSHHHSHDHSHQHHSHDHVMVYTRYLDDPVDSLAFEQLIARLPESVHRAKGVLTFSDTSSRYLFQYAYRQSDFMKIRPQVSVPDVVVFIGEQIPKALLEAELDQIQLNKK